MQLPALVLSSSKAGRDPLLAGFHRIADAAVRHVVERWLFCRYAETDPRSIGHFYAPESAVDRGTKPPPLKDIVKELKWSQQKWAIAFDTAYHSWCAMSHGSHPTGICLRPHH